ncbi:MAG: hypothetical protein HY753_03120 [Nitrospirae bacterium]|nr:hypothetical protein [Nitrospirota bacterium]
MSDMLKRVSETTGFSLAEMCTENNIVNRKTKTGNYFVINIFNMLKRRNKKASAFSLQTTYQSYISNLMGCANAEPVVFEPHRTLDERIPFSIEIFFWPTAMNIDLDECRRFCIEHVTIDWKIFSFREALFRNELLRNRATELSVTSNK